MLCKRCCGAKPLEEDVLPPICAPWGTAAALDATAPLDGEAEKPTAPGAAVACVAASAIRPSAMVAASSAACLAVCKASAASSAVLAWCAAKRKEIIQCHLPESNCNLCMFLMTKTSKP